MEVKLTRLEFEGFRSFKERQVVQFPDGDSVVLVSGTWRGSSVTSGTGKTSILEALAFALDITESSQASLKNWDSKKIFVKATLTRGQEVIEIVRDPKLSLIIDGKPWDSLTKGSKEKLTEILGISDDMLKTITYRKQRVRGKLVNSTDSEIKEFLSAPLGLNELEAAADSFTKSANQLADQIERSKLKISTMERTLQSNLVTEQELVNASASIDKAIAKVDTEKAKVAGAEADIDRLWQQVRDAQQAYDAAQNNMTNMSASSGRTAIVSQIKDIQAEIFKTEALGRNVQNKKMENASLKESIMKLKGEIEHMSKGTCPTCSREWDRAEMLREAKQKDFDKRVADFQVNVEYIKNAEPVLAELPALNARLQDMNKKLGETSAPLELASQNVNATGLSLQSARSAHNAATSTLNSITYGVKNAENVLALYRANLKGLQDRSVANASSIQELEAEKVTLAQSEDRADTFAQAAKMLGRSGFLGSIFDEILADIEVRTNDMLSHYPNASQFTVQINSTKTVKTKGTTKKEISTSISRNGIEIPSIDDVSGGQQAAVELCSDLAASEAIRARSGCAIRWMCLDEVMDGLGAIEKEAVVAMIRQRIRGLVLMIEHATEIRESFDKTIQIEYDGKESHVIVA